MELKILSWNIWSDGNFEGVKDFLSSSHADIIGLQEVTPEEPERDVVSFLKTIGYKSVFSDVPRIRTDGRKMGNAVFSKLPINKTSTYILSENKKRIAIQADIEVNKKILHIFSTHLVHTHQKISEEQNTQMENLLKTLPKEGVIVMGDFNATPQSEPIQMMQKVLKNVDSDAKPTSTWSLYPEGCETCLPQSIETRLDYIFTSKDIKSHSFKVEKSEASDHLPISVIIEV